jgi:hypothetical protein
VSRLAASWSIAPNRTELSMGQPRAAVFSMPSLLAATWYMGGCGRCQGLGMTRACSMVKKRPACVK